MNATKTGGIFTFDHDYKKLSKAIGVEEVYLDDLGTQVSSILKDFMFNDDEDIRNIGSPSQLVELCANEFSYSQLVILSSFYLQDKIDGFAKHIEKKLKNMKESVRSISLDADNLPDEIKKMLDNLTEGKTKATAVDADTLPQELKDFLKKIAEEQDRKDKNNDDD